MTKTQYIYNAFVINVVDGDTIDVKIDLGFDVAVETRLRLLGVNTNELHDKDDVKRELANKAKKLAVDRLLNRWVIIETHKQDKYGRYLATVQVDETNFNDLLISENLAVTYMI